MIEEALSGIPLNRPKPVLRREMFIYEDEAIDAVVGYRSWRIILQDGRVTLRSVIALAVLWEPGVALRKKCLCRGDLGSPLNDLPGACRGTCGIYSFSDKPKPIGGGPVANFHWHRSADYIHGEVYNWGKVKIHQMGYRAQFALPSAFYVYPNTDPLVRLRIEMAAHQFGVPLVEPATRRSTS